MLEYCYIYYYHYFIVVVVVVDDYTYCWVYLSSDHLFQVYYKVRQVLLQSATAFLLQSAIVCYYKVRQLFYEKVRQVLLQSATGTTKCDNFITKCDRYYKVRRLLQSATEQSPLLHRPSKKARRETDRGCYVVVTKPRPITNARNAIWVGRWVWFFKVFASLSFSLV